MRKISLLALLALNAVAPQVLAQDDDAELGRAQPEPDVPGSSMIDDTEPVQPAKPTTPAPKPMRARKVPAASAQDTAPTTETQTEAPAPSSSWSLMEGRRRPGSVFGFTVSRPEKIGQYNHYNFLYGREKVSPGFYGGYYLFSYLFDFGLVGHVNYYHAEGHPLSNRPALPLKRDLNTDLGDNRDDNQKLGLTLIPTQIAAEVALSPLKTRWVVLRGWLGKEYLYVQETIEPNLPSSATQSGTSTYTNSGWNEGLVTGAMVSLSLTGLDARSDNSLRALGIDRYYLSGYIENVKTTRAKFGNFDRKTYGIAFTFEGLR